MGEQPYTQITVHGGADRADVIIRTNDPDARNIGTVRVSSRVTTYHRIGRMTAMDRAVTRLGYVPTSHTLTVTINGLDVTEYC